MHSNEKGCLLTVIFRLPFKLIVAAAWLANSNVDLFIRGHKKRLHPYWVEPLINLPDLLCGLDAYYRAFL